MQYEHISDDIKMNNINDIKNVIEQIINDMDATTDNDNDNVVESLHDIADEENLQIKIMNTRSNDKLKKVMKNNVSTHSDRYGSIMNV